MYANNNKRKLSDCEYCLHYCRVNNGDIAFLVPLWIDEDAPTQLFAMKPNEQQLETCRMQMQELKSELDVYRRGVVSTIDIDMILFSLFISMGKYAMRLFGSGRSFQKCEAHFAAWDNNLWKSNEDSQRNRFLFGVIVLKLSGRDKVAFTLWWLYGRAVGGKWAVTGFTRGD